MPTEEIARASREFCVYCRDWLEQREQTARLATALADAHVQSQSQAVLLTEQRSSYESRLADLEGMYRRQCDSELTQRSALEKLELQRRELLEDARLRGHELEALHGQVRELTAKRAAAESSAAGLWTKLSQVSHEAEAAAAEIKKLKRKLETAQAQQRSAEDMLATARLEAADATAEAKGAAQAIARLTAELEHERARRMLESEVHSQEMSKVPHFFNTKPRAS